MTSQTGFITKIKNILAPSQEARTSLEDYTSEKVFRSARIVVGTVEGPRFVSSEAVSSDDLIDEMERLVGATPSEDDSSATKLVAALAEAGGLAVAPESAVGEGGAPGAESPA